MRLLWPFPRTYRMRRIRSPSLRPTVNLDQTIFTMKLTIEIDISYNLRYVEPMDVRNPIRGLFVNQLFTKNTFSQKIIQIG